MILVITTSQYWRRLKSPFILCLAHSFATVISHRRSNHSLCSVQYSVVFWSQPQPSISRKLMFVLPTRLSFGANRSSIAHCILSLVLVLLYPHCGHLTVFGNCCSWKSCIAVTNARTSAHTMSRYCWPSIKGLPSNEDRLVQHCWLLTSNSQSVHLSGGLSLQVVGNNTRTSSTNPDWLWVQHCGNALLFRSNISRPSTKCHTGSENINSTFQRSTISLFPSLGFYLNPISKLLTSIWW